MGIEREMDKTACHPSTKECEAQQSQPWPAGQPPVQETFMTRVYPPIELIDTACQVPAKGQEKYPSMVSAATEDRRPWHSSA